MLFCTTVFFYILLESGRGLYLLAAVSSWHAAYAVNCRHSFRFGVLELTLTLKEGCNCVPRTGVFISTTLRTSCGVPSSEPARSMLFRWSMVCSGQLRGCGPPGLAHVCSTHGAGVGARMAIPWKAWDSN